MSGKLDDICVAPDASIHAAMRAIDNGKMQIALVVDADGRLLGTVTDGDIRRALLAGKPMDAPVRGIIGTHPITLPLAAGRPAARRLMRERRLHHVPLLDEQGRLADLAWVDEIIGLTPNTTRVVLMAGGLGQRLRPLTEHTPKPMLPVGGRPLLEVIIRNLVEQGFGRFTISVNYLGGQIRDHFGDGGSLGVEIDYIDEQERMGTAGALSLLRDWPDSPFVVMNGDLLTTLRFEQLLQFHIAENASATMGAREFTMQVPYGVLQVDGKRLSGIEEKPNQSFFVNAGIYVLSPNVAAFIKAGEPLDMPDLFRKLMVHGDIASVYPIRDYWTDIGRIEDLERARGEYEAVFSR